MNKRTRLLAVVNSEIQKLGSFEDYLAAYARKARELGWSLCFVFPSIHAGGFSEWVKKEGADVMTAGESWSSPHGVKMLAEYIRNYRPDIVNFHFCGPNGYLPLFLQCRRAGMKTVYHYHGEIRPLHTLKWRNRHASLMRIASLLWTRVITVSNANREFLHALHVHAPVDVVYNGIDVNRFLSKSAEMSEIAGGVSENGALNCLYIGSLIRRKRVDVLLRAFSIVLQHCPAAKLTIVGGGPLEKDCKDLAAGLGIESAVRFAGLLMDYPFDLLKRCDVFVSASESESFGLIFAEAMSFRLPIVACKIGGIPEVIEDGKTGILAAANDCNALAEAMITLLRSPDMRMQMGTAGWERVQKLFQLSDTIDKTFEIFNSMS